MATLQSLALASPVAQHLQHQTRSFSGTWLLCSCKKCWNSSIFFVRNVQYGRGNFVVFQIQNCSGSWAVNKSSYSLFNGQSLCLPRLRLPLIRRKLRTSGLVTMTVKPAIQFVQGADEQTVPDVRLTKSRDGTNGMAIFTFDQPSVFDSSAEVGDITGFYMIDEEGILQSVDVNAKFVNGKPERIEAKYIMRTPREWDRFMRFMERYANANGLQFVKK
ncbi:hypothetical protein NC652_007625 [Populus alba x Populus x berolinensis]|uniref:Photosystem II reaction center Psb28 protein n=1 Tax=Populus tomentosa TaxID=118781 RepID=A0A8X8AIK8_POPTO|nr:hypothetical protein POTOM_009121 [Populus tomentosa]KAJ6956606.1 hypothetical protein NC652_007625 [Populus alba x Populus x berolinensis]